MNNFLKPVLNPDQS